MSITNSPLARFVHKLKMRKPLDPEDEAAVLALPFSLRTIQPHQYVVWEGEKPTHSCVIISGYAYRQKVAGNGSRQILSIHMTGDVIDLQNSLLGRADHNVQALTRLEVAIIPVEAIRNLAFARPMVGMAMWHETLVDGSIFREWIVNVGRRDARTRLAHLLCEFSIRLDAADLGRPDVWELPMTQEQLADCTGLTSVHVNRSLKGLERDGLINRTKRSVRVDDWGKLAAAGDFNSRYLHLSNSEMAA